jgi:drug/metabolite transporter (DMT)-like permease
MLTLATVCWGLSFPVTKDWLNAAEASGFPGGTEGATFTLLAMRIPLALTILAVWQPWLFRAPNRRDWSLGLTLGIINGLGTCLQIAGLAWTSPALSVFLTSLASVWVPLLAYVCFGTKVAALTLLGLAFGMGGVAVLGLQINTSWTLGPGEWLTLASTVVFAFVILLLDRWGRTVPSGHLSIGFLVGMGIPAIVLAVARAVWGPGIAAWLSGTAALLRDPAVLRDVLLLVIFPTVLSFLWMSTYQPRVSASRAALIYLLEPVFGSAFSLAWGHDELTARLLIGGGFILGGNLLVEVPGWLRERV